MYVIIVCKQTLNQDMNTLGDNMKRKNFLCGLRKLGKYPNGNIGRLPSDYVYISYGKDRKSISQSIICTQADARLIAKRINQFIDGGG